MGVKALGDMVKTFSCKLWWRLHQHDSIWSEFMFSKYLKVRHPLVAQTYHPIGTWKLLGIRDMADAQIRYSLEASMVDYWLDT